ncbi:hypothetical protein CRENBAI_010854 [Crenichthys baileyi]|uniref:Uncharacterized protein n=1 Tax=Crenichthys baileyi TaxID=28760 RepID=A0AAV9RUC1_9TELE
MFPPTTDPADKLKADALDRWVELQKEEAMRNLPTNLEVLPSPLLLEQMEREAAQHQRVREGCFVPPPQLRCSPPASAPAAKPSSSSRRRNRRRAGVNSRWAGEEVVSLPADVRAAASKPAPSSATAMSPRLPAASIPASSSTTTKIPRLTAAPPMQSSGRCSEATPEELEEHLRFFARQIKTSGRPMQRIKQMYEDYEMALRLFYCRPPSPTPSHKSSAAAAVEQPTSGLQTAAATVEQPTSGLQSAAAAFEQPTSGLQHAAEFPEGPVDGLPPRPGPEHLLFFLWGVLMELRPDTGPDTPQSDSRPDTPQPDSRPDTPQPRMRLTLSLPQPPPHVAEDVVRGTPRLNSSSVSATPQLLLTPLRVSATPQLLLVLASEPCDEGFEEEAPTSWSPTRTLSLFLALLPSLPLPTLCGLFFV